MPGATTRTATRTAARAATRTPATTERVSVEAYHSTAGTYLIYLQHLATYEFARRFTTGARVLDFGCGTGYGTFRLAGTARSVVGVDISVDAIAAARSDYLERAASTGTDLDYRLVRRIEQAPLPFADNSFDTVLSFQVIEHVPSVDSYLDEVRRVLRPGGAFICATPDRRTRLHRGQRPFNRFHLQEWAPEEFREILDRFFTTTTVYGMSGTADVVDIEIRRCRTTRLLAYPFTFPGAPERWRQWGLRGLGRLRDHTAHGPGHGGADDAAAGPTAAYDFGLDDILIAPDAWPSTNIVTVSS